MSQQNEVEKQAAMDLAEDSREAEWKFPSFVGELFQGNFRWEMLHPFPEQSADDKQIGDDLIEKVRPVMEKYIDPEEVDRTANIPKEAIDALAEVGVWGMKIPKKYGGLELSQTNYNRVCGFISTYCGSTGATVSAHQSIGVPQPLKYFGTEEQKQKYMPKFAKGAISAFALTEPGVGSDPAKMTTTAELTEDGQHYVINGEKLWCTNGPIADYLIVMAVTPPKMVNGKEKKQISAFIVDKDMPGFETVHLCSFMGIRGIKNGLLRFDNVKVPVENILGKPGDGLRIAFATLSQGRLTIPGTAAAGGKAALAGLKDWCNERVQWGSPIGGHQAVAQMMADMTADTYAMDAMQLLACQWVEKGQKDIRLEAAIAKYFCTEAGYRIADDALQVRGGRGYEQTQSLRRRGEQPLPMERGVRDARISRIVEGTTEIMQLFIAREAMDPHMRRIVPIMAPHIMKSDKSKGRLFAEAFAHYVRWIPKQYFPARSDYPTEHLNSENRAHLAYIGRTAKRLARTMFFTMGKYGPKLEYEQIIMSKFVDIGTLLFAMAATLARAEGQLKERGGDDNLQNVVDLFCRNARKTVEDSFRDVKKNHNHMYKKVTDAYMEGEFDWMFTSVYDGVPPMLEITEPGATSNKTVEMEYADKEKSEEPVLK